MEIGFLTSVISAIFILTAGQVKAQPYFQAYHCEAKQNYTKGSSFETNLRQVLSSLPSSTGNGYGFYNLSSSSSSGEDRVYATALCRGDVEPGPCRSCLRKAADTLLKSCPYDKEAVSWQDICMLRYARRPLIGKWNPNRQNISSTSKKLSSPQEVMTFKTSLSSLLNRLRNKAAAGGHGLKFAADNASGLFQTIYAVVQCTPDLSTEYCVKCLDYAIAEVPEWFHVDSPASMMEGARVDGTSCSFRYDTTIFFNPDVSAEPPSTKTTTEKGLNHMLIGVVIAVVSIVILSVVVIIFVCVNLRVRRNNKRIETRPSNEPAEEIESAESLQYSFETIRIATDNFSEENKLGQGGFGSVYKGSLSTGQEIAVKRLSTNSGQGDLEFKNEVMLVARLQHRNLVRLLGFCLEGSERLLIYEFVPNASLDHFIFDPRKREDLNWSRRYKIIGGIARGLLYLHEDSRLRIIHRDLKASNILLDEEMHPKISDFGMARLFLVDQTQGNTSRIVGTYGYMAPEYAMHGQFSVKSDVFSFGVLLLEIVSGQKNNFFCHENYVEDLLSYTWRNWNDGTASSIVDPLVRHGQGSEIIRCIHIALLCVQDNVAHRPTMNTVVLMLNSDSLSLPAPSEPAFFMQSSIRTNNSMDFNSMVIYGSEQSKKSGLASSSSNENTITDLYVR